MWGRKPRHYNMSIQMQISRRKYSPFFTQNCEGQWPQKKTAAAECGRPYKIRFGFVTSRHRGRISQYAILNRHLGPNTDCTYVACGSSLFAEEEEEEQKTRNYPVDIDSDFCRNNIL